MKTLPIALLIVLTVSMLGCQMPPGDAVVPDPMDAWLVSAYADEGVRNAVLTQRALYPYHFEADGEALNEIGRNDLGILASHFRDHAGTLNLHTGEAAPALAVARVKTVRDALAAAGVEPERVVFADGLPGGEGMGSIRVLKVLVKMDGGLGTSKGTQQTSYGATSTDGQPSGGAK